MREGRALEPRVGTYRNCAITTYERRRSMPVRILCGVGRVFLTLIRLAAAILMLS